jgi:hypothetical protein
VGTGTGWERAGPVLHRGGASDLIRQLGGTPREWSDGPGAVYGRHHHPEAKLLCCLRGSLAFRLDQGPPLGLEVGDWLELAAGTHHAALVGPCGVTCVEVFLPGPLSQERRAALGVVALPG